jgi:cytochrome c peroxidase
LFSNLGFEPESAHGANAGLAVARDILEKIHQKHPEISYGDLWTLAGVCAVQELVRTRVYKISMT